MAKQIVLGILAHVDAGKTTLSEAMLYTSGSIRKLGRVDRRDTFLDTDERERSRGITIFSKQARLTYEDMEITLMDTPGHVDFSAEMERTLEVLDYAVLVISGADGVQGHTRTLWNLLRQYRIPTFLFINKMDQEQADQEKLMEQLYEELDSACVDFSSPETKAFYENIAMCDEAALEDFLASTEVGQDVIRRLITERKVFPCFFGSALRLDGVEELLRGLHTYTSDRVYGEAFGAAVFKIGRDEQGNRLTYMKITGGSLKVRTLLETGSRQGDELPKEDAKQAETKEEKVNQIRLYSGRKYETVPEAFAGTICAVTGLLHTYPQQGLGIQKEAHKPYLEPVLTYSLEFPDGNDKSVMLQKLRMLEEECPEMHMLWDENLKEIHVQVMGEVQIEILKSLIEERFHVRAEFSEGSIVYKETIEDVVEGVGHFEPLRHYAEVHLLLEPLKRGSGLWFDIDCSEDLLSRNWQRLVLTHLKERRHRGVLTGAEITDMKITLVSGKAHIKHTEGGDFRQATYRAVRQGLKKARSALLEPYYAFRLEVPEHMVGRAMTDVEKLGGQMKAPQLTGQISVLEGIAPVAAMRNYQKEVNAYTKGMGKLTCSFYGYEECRNTEEITAEKGYDSELDYYQPTGSVFCSHGAGTNVPWNEVEKYMHLPSILKPKSDDGVNDDAVLFSPLRRQREETSLGTEEIDEILYRASHANTRSGANERQKLRSKKPSNDYPVIVRKAMPVDKKERYLLVDGYNVIFAWEELKELAGENIDGARGRLLDILCNYQAIRKYHLIVVFDAYRVKGHGTEIMDYHNIHVVFTKEAETADQYIEKFTHEHGKKYDITVATSDGLEQIIVTGQGARLISSRELLHDVRLAEEEIRESMKLYGGRDGEVR
ncbi:MAG: TetM/TetW/TetO/TetS family tetracycline resistance ribosomal protection protein [Lachnospiraceae bacterium]|nr:TetM/TetW/TetO/TetS family tetracycline resistance ribosomal protection protein [Lachnospiraceae bacterium]